MQESTNLPPRFPQPPEETTWYRSLWLQGFPSSQAGDGAHALWLFQRLAEPPKLERGTLSPEEEESKEEEGERVDLPGEGGTPPTPCLLPWGGGEEPLPTRSCLLPLGGIPLSPKLALSGAEGSFRLLEI